MFINKILIIFIIFCLTNKSNDMNCLLYVNRKEDSVMKRINLLLGTFLFAISALFLVGCETASAEAQYLTIEINPGIEILLNADDEITEINPLNEDGEILLVDLDLIGTDIEVAIEEIIDEATNLGYVNLEQVQNQVRIQAFGKNDDASLALGEKVRTKVQATLQTRGINGEAVMKQDGEETQTAAQAKGVDVARYVMAQKILMEDPELKEDELLALSLSELIDMKQAQVREMKQIVAQLRTEYKDELALIIEEYRPLIQALEAEIEQLVADIAAETDGEAKATLEATLLEKQNELETLKQTMHDERDALRDEYLPLSVQARTALQTEHQNRIQENLEKVNQFRENHPLPDKSDPGKKN